MSNEALARKTAIKTVGDRDLMNLEVATAYILSALNEAVKEKDWALNNIREIINRSGHSSQMTHLVATIEEIENALKD